jgi:hypothetical protein
VAGADSKAGAHRSPPLVIELTPFVWPRALWTEQSESSR